MSTLNFLGMVVLISLVGCSREEAGSCARPSGDAALQFARDRLIEELTIFGHAGKALNDGQVSVEPSGWLPLNGGDVQPLGSVIEYLIPTFAFSIFVMCPIQR